MSELRAALERDEEDWAQAIRAWLGPQRLSVEPIGAERHYGRIGVVVAAIIRAALAAQSDGLDIERLARALIQTGIYIDETLMPPKQLASVLVREYDAIAAEDAELDRTPEEWAS